MSMRRAILVFTIAGSFCVAPGLANAHITVASGPGFANTTQEISFGVAHRVPQERTPTEFTSRFRPA